MIETVKKIPRLLGLAALATAWLACGGAREEGMGAAAARNGEIPDLSASNLLFITIDTLRADRLGSYGHAGAETPVLDALTRDGVRFANVYSSVALTLPSHSTMFTGLYPFATGVRVNGVHFLGEGETTLAERFQSAGYGTAAAVAAYVVTSKFGLDQGFDEYDDTLGTSDLFKAFESDIPAAGVYRKFERWLGDYLAAGSDGTAEGPFFTWLHFYDPHLPYQPPADLASRFSADPYDGEIANVDRYIGRVMDDLRRAGLLDDTLVIVTSDHGEAFGEHVEEGHGLLAYEETLRVPMIFHAPARLAGGRMIEERVALVDLMPTILELFGLAPATGLHGESFAARLSTQRAAGPSRESESCERREIYVENLAGKEFKNWAPLTGLISGAHKYLAAPQPELYDLDRDPAETVNLVSRERRRYRELDDRLRALLLAAASDGAGEDSRRELSAEDERNLQALGYLGASTDKAKQVLDPKRGIGVEMTIRQVRARVENGEIDQADRQLEGLIADNPDLEIPGFWDLRHDIRASRGDENGAVAVLEEGVAKFPDLEPLEFKLASYLFEIGRYDETERRCRRLLAENPKLSQALNLMGLIAQRRGDLGEAAGYYRRGIEVEPNNIPLQTRLADTLVEKGEIAQALAIYDRLAASGVLDADAEKLFKAAALNTRLGRLARAEILFERGLALKPGGLHHLSLALVMTQTGKIPQAVEHLETAVGDYRDDLTPEQLALAGGLLGQLRNAG